MSTPSFGHRATAMGLWWWQEPGEDVLLEEQVCGASVNGSSLRNVPADGAQSYLHHTPADRPQAFILVVTNLRLALMLNPDDEDALYFYRQQQNARERQSAPPHMAAFLSEHTAFALPQAHASGWTDTSGRWDSLSGVWNVIPLGMLMRVTSSLDASPLTPANKNSDPAASTTPTLAPVLAAGGLLPHAPSWPGTPAGGRQADDRGAVTAALWLECYDLRRVDIYLASGETLLRVLRLLQGKPFSPERFLNGRLQHLLKEAQHQQPAVLAAVPMSHVQEVCAVPEQAARVWRISYVNDDFLLSDTYPRRLLVPASITDTELLQAASFRSRGRVPVCEYVHSNGASICRSGQPKIGLALAHNEADERLVASLAAAGRGRRLDSTGAHELGQDDSLCILDARPALSALANHVRGGGVESSGRYEGAEVVHLGIDNIHVVRAAFRGLGGGAGLEEGGGARGEGPTKWLSSISSILAGSVVCADKVEAGTSVLVHCSDGWDRTPQISALATLMVCAEARTIEGFCALLQRSWVSFGHKFSDRCGRIHVHTYMIWLAMYRCGLG